MANSNPISASGIPMTCKTIACTAIVTDPAKGGAASVASVVDKLIKDNKQLLDEAEHDIKNYSDRGQCYLPKRS